MKKSEAPRAGVVMGSASDWPTLKHAVEMLQKFEIPCEWEIVSAHRTPERLREYAQQAAGRGLEVIIAGAGGAAHLPGMLASWSTLQCSACRSRAACCAASTRCCRSCRCPRASRSARLPSAKPVLATQASLPCA